MILPDRKDAVHKAWLYRLLTAIYDNHVLSATLFFKGGTCASMRGLLDRFSIDLDFDYVGKKADMKITGAQLETIFNKLGLEIKTQSAEVPQYFLRYPNPLPNERNTLKIDVTTDPPKSNRYEPVRLIDIDRIATCQTVETMFANKLVAMIERHELRGGIAGRDLYDIHHYFLQGFTYNEDIIRERRSVVDITVFFNQLIDFIEKKATQTIINQDLNVLLPPVTFRRIRNTLKAETIMFLKDEVKRIT